MRRPAVWALAVIVTVVAVLSVVLLTTTSGSEPVALSRSGVTVRLDRAAIGRVDAVIEAPESTNAVSVFATMPQMGHVMPPIVATKDGPGRYRASGELFSMRGRWELSVQVDGVTVTFEVVVG